MCEQLSNFPRVRNTKACVEQEDVASWHLSKLCCILALVARQECPSPLILSIGLCLQPSTALLHGTAHKIHTH